MLGKIVGLKTLFGKDSLKKYKSILSKINFAGEKLKDKSDDELITTLNVLRSGDIKGEELLVNSFALCREASHRILGMRHYDVQIIGGLVLNDGKIAEMKTGEGKTLAASLAVFYRSLIGEQVHLVTANEYLASRDESELKKLYDFLGVRSSSISASMTGKERQEAYKHSDVIYGTSSEFAFDYLRDNTITDASLCLQAGHAFAIIDEVDSILIDEARMPLIVSGRGEKDESMVAYLNSIAMQFSHKWFDEKTDDNKGDFEEDMVIYEKNKDVVLTDNGYEKLEELLLQDKVLPYKGALYDSKNLYLIGRFTSSVKGMLLYKRDIDYVVRDGNVVIINQQTGRLESGKRWSDGLHQVIENKEGVELQAENTSIASTTLQNYFRLYSSISGMTGTALSDAEEFLGVYNLEIVAIPTNKPMIRKDKEDRVYMSKEAKTKAIVEEIVSEYKKGRPILVGTSSVEESEDLADRLRKAGLIPNVLNAKNHLREAEIIAQAGMPGKITIATNMAGRGTDIHLGGSLKSWINGLKEQSNEDVEALQKYWKVLNQKVINSGGLHVIGTSRNESGRVDNQLKGRAGRQGDPGSSVFYVSMEDDLMRLFGGNRFINMFKSLGVEEHECVSHRLIDKGILESQKKVEERNAKFRKELLRYDDVVNIQRSHIYDMRKTWLLGNPGSIPEINQDIVKDVVLDLFEEYLPKGAFEETWDTKGLEQYFETNWKMGLSLSKYFDDKYVDEEKMRNETVGLVFKHIIQYSEQLSKEMYDEISRQVMVASIDKHWHEQLNLLDQLKQSIHLRGYAQKDPLMEYKKDALKYFEDMMLLVKKQYAAGLLLSIRETVDANKTESI